MPSFSIRSSTIRLGIFISTLVIAVIVIFQLIWLKKVYRFEEKEFDHGVIKAIRGLYEDIEANAYYSSHLDSLIERPGANIYIARLGLPVNTDSLTSYLHYELEDFNIFTDCHIGLYSAASAGFIYTGILESPGINHQHIAAIPRTSRAYDHLVLYFPKRQQYILTQMNFWIITSALLLFVLLLFGTSLYYFYKQKFLNETQKDFIHNFTHEFKTPVTVMSLAADVLKDEIAADRKEKLTTYAGIVGYQSAYLQNQIENLLRFANAESRQLRLTREKVNIHDLIREAIANLTPLVNNSKTEISFVFGATAPFLSADRDYLIIVITNLVDNAIKYSKQPRITITTANKHRSVLFSIRDNGIGIEKRQINKIFRKFFRVRHGETYAAKGFGIGLSFVKKIVDAHGGRITIQSVPGQGSDFIVELPV